MRERTTWNRQQIKSAATQRQADPYLMNQDHVKPQPGADDYVIGTPSDFAEDVTSPNRWEEEYKGGVVNRNEIGQPEMRGDTYNHPEKTASETVLLKKADLCVKTARIMLGSKATEAAVEDQAFGLMYMPDAELIHTFDRLAGDQEGPKEAEDETEPEPKQQQKQATMPQLAQKFADAIQQGKPEEAKEAMAQLVQQAAQQQQQQQEQQQQAQAQPQQQAPAPQGQQQQQAQAQPQQQAPAPQGQQQQQQQAQAQPQQQAPAPQQDQQQQAGYQQQAQGGPQGPQIAQLVAQMVQEALGQQAPAQAPAPAPQQQQAQAGPQVQPTADDTLLDDMLAPEPMVEDTGMNIELEPAPMDVGEVQLGPEDDVLRTLFAAEGQEQEEEQGQGQQQQQQQKQAANVRTASTRTVGTRPTQGVSRVGGSAAAPTRGAEIDKLTALWPSAPDVSGAFGMNR